MPETWEDKYREQETILDQTVEEKNELLEKLNKLIDAWVNGTKADFVNTMHEMMMEQK